MPTPPTGTILLVDDEDGVRVALRRQLVHHGHTVLEASHGAEAIAVVRMRRGNLDLVLAKGELLDHCRANNIGAVEFKNFRDVEREVLKRLVLDAESGRSV